LIVSPDPEAIAVSVSTVSCFFTEGYDDLVPVLFVEACLGLVTAATLPFNASFYLANAFSASNFSASFSSSCLHLAM
jgi:hypothetical protein